MGACASKSREIDLRDICQGLCCFFTCCKGQIVIHTTEVDSAEIEDIDSTSASFQYNCAKNGKGLKIGTKEADTT